MTETMFNDFHPIDPDRVKPFVYEDAGTLSLHFDISAIQSRMRRDDPAALDLDYTRAMMACLLFEPQPKSMLMIGLGGGSLPSFTAWSTKKVEPQLRTAV